VPACAPTLDRNKPANVIAAIGIARMHASSATVCHPID
jgi:hypothetical protein